ncbi:DUF2341 domain-containing protein, partial [Patescibacteria group bacterium]
MNILKSNKLLRNITKTSFLVSDFRSILLRRKFIFIPLFILFIFSPLVYLITKQPNIVKAAWFDDGYLYRKVVEITNAGSDLTDFQTSFTLDTATLITATKMQSDCDDIRITDVNGKELPHWIEDGNPGCNDASTKIWVKIPSIPTSGAVLYIYYGNPSAKNGEKPDNVFEFFDDFEANNMDKWESSIHSIDSYSLTTVTAQKYDGTYGAEAYQTSDGAGRDAVAVHSLGSSGTRVFEFKYYDDTSITSGTHMAGGTLGNINVGLNIGTTANFYSYRCGGSWTATTTARSTGWHKIKIAYQGASTSKVTIDGDEYTSGLDSCLTNTGNIAFGTYWSVAEGLYVDQVFSREYAATEPTAGTPGTEETAPQPLAYWKFDEGYGSTAYDTTENNNDGTISGSSWRAEEYCISGKCLFNGETADNNIQTGNTVPVPSAYSLSLWFKGEKTNQIAENIYILGWDSKISLTLQDTSQNPRGGILIRNSADTGFYSLWNSVDLLDNKWHQLAATVDTSSLEVNIYIDGQLNKSTTIADHWSGVENLQIGSWTTTYGNFTGFIDEAKIYPYARTSAQIKSDYQRHAGAHGTSAVLGTSKDNLDSLNNGLVGYWSMDENTGTSLGDSSGIGNTGTFGTGSSAPSWSTSKFGPGLSFDGTDDYVNLSVIELEGKTGSMAAWVKLDSADPGNARVLGRYWQQHSIGTASDTPTDQWRAWWNNVALNGGTVDTNWHHLAVTYNGFLATDNIKFFVDGELVKTANNTEDNLGDDNRVWQIGTHGSNAYNWDGLIDDVRLYNRTLSATEVRQLYNHAPGSVLEWKLDEKTGTTVYDTTGLGHTAAFSGGGITWVNGKYGNALNFDAASNHISAADADDLSSESFTLNFWFKWNESQGNWPRIGKFNTVSADTDNEYCFQFKQDDGRWYIRFNDSAVLYTQSSGEDLDTTIDKWHFISITYDSLTDKLKIQQNLELELLNVENDFTITPSANLFRFTGHGADSKDLDHVQYYNYARTQSQLIEDMNAGHPIGGSPVGSQVAYWKFNTGYGSTAYDSSSNENNGNLAAGASAPSWTSAGKYGKALDFDGSDDQITIPTSAGGSLDPDTLTVSAWINPDNTDAGTRRIFQRTSGAYGIYQSGSDLLYYVDTQNDGGAWKALSTTISANTWQHITGTYDGTTMNLYLNGIKVGSTDNTGSIDNGGSNAFIATNSGSDQFFDGIIDEVKIYSTALTEDEVKLEYNMGKALVLGTHSTNTGSTAASYSSAQEYCVPGDSSSCNPPVMEWRFDEKSGSTAYDSIGNGNTGALLNMEASDWVVGHSSGNALNFDGSEDYVLGHNDAELQITQGTVEAWIKTSNPGSTYRGIVIKQGAYGMFLNDNEFGIYDWDTSTWRGTNTDLNDNKWHHVAFTFDSGVASGTQVYIDGQLQLNTTMTINSQGQAIVAASGNQSGNQFFNGIIDYVKVFNYERTPAQVAWDYNNGGPVGWWKFNECEDATVYDSSGVGNTGAISVGTSAPQTTVGSCGIGNTAAAWYNGADGKYNSSLNFDGTDDYITLLNNDDSDVYPDDDISISVWAKPDTTTSSQTVWSYGRDGGSGKAHLRRNGSQWQAAFWTSGINIDGGIATQDQWHHLVLIITGDNTLLYVNGQLAASGDGNQNINAGVGALYHYLGREEFTALYFWDG